MSSVPDVRGSLARPGAPDALALKSLSVRFGGIAALTDVSFSVKRGGITGLIGPNGAGKTTVFNCISRFYTPVSGDIVFEGQSLLRKAVHEVSGAGIGRTFQNVALFPSLTVFDNIRIGTHATTRGNLLSDALRLPWQRTDDREVRARVEQEIDYLGLGRYAGAKASALPFGVQKRVELARALATRPALILLDEPAAGLNHEEVHALGELVQRLDRERGVTILLVEHHMQLVMSICTHIVVLNFGQKIAEGTPAQIQGNETVINAYLGDFKHERIA